MALIEFKDLPDTTTPLTANNLNNNFEYLEEKTEDINNTMNKMKTITLNNTWFVCHRLYGGGISTIIPIYNPNNIEPTINLESVEVFASGSWQSVNYNTGNYNKTYLFLSFDAGNLPVVDGSSYLIRMTGTITIEDAGTN